MASPVVVVLCAVLLSACSGDAARPYRQFETVNPGDVVCVQDGVAYPVGAPVPSNDPCKESCSCWSSGDILCMTAKSPKFCHRFLSHPPCIDVEYVRDPAQCCPTMVCPNGPNCRAHPSGQIIPVDQVVMVNGAECYCSAAAAGYSVMCTPTTPPPTTTLVPSTITYTPLTTTTVTLPTMG